MTTTADDATVPDGWVDAVRALGRMPYGAMLEAPRLTVQTADLPALAAHLSALVVRLEHHAEHERNRDARLERLDRLVSAGRDLLDLLTEGRP